MVYGQLQYYCDELESWTRIINFHKDELQESLRHISLISHYSSNATPTADTFDPFASQFIEQEQRFEHLGQLISGQLQRLQRNTFLEQTMPGADLNQQSRLRTQMKTAERVFSRVKYNFSSCLSSFLSSVPRTAHV